MVRVKVKEKVEDDGDSRELNREVRRMQVLEWDITLWVVLWGLSHIHNKREYRLPKTSNLKHFEL